MAEEPTPGFRARGGLWVLAQIPLLLLAFLIPLYSDAPFPPQQPAQVIGVALLGAGLLLSLAGLFKLGEALTPFPHPLAGAQLRTGGVYGLVRHPIYAGLLFMALGWTLWRLSFGGFLVVTVLVLFFDAKARHEETRLAQRFPDYAAYKTRVKKFLPFIY